jgi:hypothetical protein
MSYIGEIIMQRNLTCIDKLEIMEDEEENGLANLRYRQISSDYPNLKSDEFLEIFNALTESHRCLIPENYPLTQIDFQTKVLYERYAWNKPNNKKSLNDNLILD